MRHTRFLRRGIAAIAALALAGSLVSCAESQRDTGSTTDEASGGGDFVFAASSDPVMLDPAMAWGTSSSCSCPKTRPAADGHSSPTLARTFVHPDMRRIQLTVR